MLHNKRNQFQRTASLRLRDKKSNLFSDIKMEMEHGTNHMNSHFRTHNDRTMHETSKNNQYTDNILTTGRNSPSRKLVLTSQNTIAARLTRSLSLRRNYNINQDTTDSQQELSTCTVAVGAAESIKNLQLQHSTVDYKETNGKSDEFRENDMNDDIKDNIDDVMADNTQNKDIQKLSLKTNCEAITTSLAPAVEAGAIITSETIQQYHPRPATLTTTIATVTASITGNETASPLKEEPAKSPKTPKTSKTPTTTQASSQSKQIYHYYAKQKPLTSVLESKTKLSPKTPPVTPDSPTIYWDDDLDSMYSFATTTSGRSTMSCEHPYVARNGTTFSGRKMKYVVHCSNYAGQVGPDYLTPTQRAQRQIRRLKELLCIARQDLEQKDSEILRLTREVVELRLFKASLASPEERSASSDAVTVREAELKTSQDVSPIVDMVDLDAIKSSPRHKYHNHNIMQNSTEMQSSFADSGHFEDMISSSVHSKDSSYIAHAHHDIACGTDEAVGDENEDCSGAEGGSGVSGIKHYERQRQELIRLYEHRIEDLIRTQDTVTSEIKHNHNDKVEALLQKLGECNTRYADIVPDYENAKERIRELEKQLEDLQRKLADHEDRQNKMYLQMYQKGQEAERIARADQALELAYRAPNSKVSINELLYQLQSTQDELENIRAAECRNECGSNHALLTAKEAISLWVLGARKTIYRRLMEAQKNRTHVDPEVTLQFLKSAIYYFLTDKENSQGHLQAIESILEFTEAEKLNISKARTPK